MKKSFLAGLFLAALLCPPVSAGVLDWFRSGRTQPTQSGPLPEIPTEVPPDFNRLVEELTVLVNNMATLQAMARDANFVYPNMVWEELLKKKVLQQFQLRAALTVVFAGGTKSGKSTTFNYVARQNLSKTDHRAAATKQAVVAVPPNLHVPNLALMFEGMQVVFDSSPEDATEDSGAIQKLLVRQVATLPSDMILIDIPDMDSDQVTNHQKAIDVTKASDVVIAMITPAKHGDHAVVDFFKALVTATKKPIVVIINQVPEFQLEGGEWKDYLKIFCQKTDIHPLAAYVSQIGRAHV